MHKNLNKKQKLIQTSGILRSPKRIYKNKSLQKFLGIDPNYTLNILKQYDNVITALKEQFNDNWDILITINNEIFICIYYPSMEIYSKKLDKRRCLKDVYILMEVYLHMSNLSLGSPKLMRGACNMFEYDKGFLYPHSPRVSQNDFNDYFFNKNFVCLGHSEIESSLSNLNVDETFNLEDLKTFFFYLDVIIPIEDTDGVYSSISSLDTLTQESSRIQEFEEIFNISENMPALDGFIDHFLIFLKQKNIFLQDVFDILVNKNNIIITEKEELEKLYIEFLQNHYPGRGLYYLEGGKKYIYIKSEKIVLPVYQKIFIKTFKKYIKSSDVKFIIFRGEKRLPKIQTYLYKNRSDEDVEDNFYLSSEWINILINYLKKTILNEYYRKKHQSFCTEIF